MKKKKKRSRWSLSSQCMTAGNEVYSDCWTGRSRDEWTAQEAENLLGCGLSDDAKASEAKPQPLDSDDSELIGLAWELHGAKVRKFAAAFVYCDCNLRGFVLDSVTDWIVSEVYTRVILDYRNGKVKPAELIKSRCWRRKLSLCKMRVWEHEIVSQTRRREVDGEFAALAVPLASDASRRDASRSEEEASDNEASGALALVMVIAEKLGATHAQTAAALAGWSDPHLVTDAQLASSLELSKPAARKRLSRLRSAALAHWSQ